MLKSFCASSNFKALLQGESCPKALQDAVTVLRRKWDNESPTDSLPPIQSHNIEVIKLGNGVNGRLRQSDSEEAFRIAFGSASIELGVWKEEMDVQSHKRIKLGGVTFARAVDSERDAHVSFYSMKEGRRVPGIIEAIYSMERGGK